MCVAATQEVSATSGKLQSDSICTGSDGVTYGKHSQDDPHWHVAEDHGESGWYPNGAPVADNPCATAPAEEVYVAPVEEAYVAPVEEVPAETYEEPVDTYIAPVEEIIIVNEAPVIVSTSSSKTISEKDIVGNGFNTDELIEMFGISATNKEDSLSSLNITASPSSISSTSYGENEIIFSVTDSNGNVDSITTSLVIEQYINVKPVIELDDTCTYVFYEKPTLAEILSEGCFTVNDTEDGNMEVTEENIEVTDSEIIVKVTDSSGDVTTNKQPYTIEETSSFGGIIILGAIVMGIVYFVKKSI